MSYTDIIRKCAIFLSQTIIIFSLSNYHKVCLVVQAKEILKCDIIKMKSAAKWNETKAKLPLTNNRENIYLKPNVGW